MFQRALRRSAIELCYSRGYNPRPKLSLPLPRSVGVSSDDELLYASVSMHEDEVSSEGLRQAIQSQLPCGCELTDISLCPSKVSFRPLWADYEFPLAATVSRLDMQRRIEGLMQRITKASPILVDRRPPKRHQCPRSIDVRPYIASLELSDDSVCARCNITPSGSVRIDEVMQLLETAPRDIEGAVVRKHVEWENN